MAHPDYGTRCLLDPDPGPSRTGLAPTTLIPRRSYQVTPTSTPRAVLALTVTPIQPPWLREKPLSGQPLTRSGTTSCHESESNRNMLDVQAGWNLKRLADCR